jgi:hypothetical protein
MLNNRSVYRAIVSILTAELLKSINLFSRMLTMCCLSRSMLVDWMIGQNRRIRGFHGRAEPPDVSFKRAGKGFHQAFQNCCCETDPDVLSSGCARIQALF